MAYLHNENPGDKHCKNNKSLFDDGMRGFVSEDSVNKLSF